jgi:hypothetical protein
MTLREQIDRSLSEALTRVRDALDEALGNWPISQDAYVQYLSDQAYMVHDVCRQMLGVAAHPTMLRRPALRKFLIAFGLEEETHHRLAEADLKHLGAETRKPSLDAKLWFMYCASLVTDSPVRRIGFSVVLENSGKVIGPTVQAIFAKAPFLTDSNTRFVRAHLHDDIPHGDQLLEAIDACEWTPEESAELVGGINDAGTMLVRLIRSDFEECLDITNAQKAS